MTTLLAYPETIAHWIILLPFLAFAFIVIELTFIRDTSRFFRRKREESVETDASPAVPLPTHWTVFFSMLGVAVVIFALAIFRGKIAVPAAFLASGKFWLSFLFFAWFIFWPRNTRKWIQKYGPYISVGAIGIGAIIATSLFIKMLHHGVYMFPDDTGVWKEAFNTVWYGFGDYKVNIGVKLDGFGIFGVWMVTVVATCIQWFSLGYMWDDDYGRKHIARYFAKHSLFVTGMLGVVLSDNILTFLIGWEVMGLCSYLLIGFFTYKPSANAAQLKAFITTRIGDVGFMLGVFLLGLMYTYTKQPVSFNFDDIRAVVAGYNWFTPDLNLAWLPTAAALLIFLGAVGKSAQFPLHVWLPDAMEGPTPVSALIHAATMVAAGVFLVVRFFWLFEMSHTAMMTVAIIGAITAFGGATIGLVQYDIKRILAYSTISQLGYMMIGLGVGAVGAGMFHLLTHAYFKALLFLGSGAVIYGCRHIQDIRYMGGLSKKMPITYITFLAGTLALAGIFPFAGFWSKDEILGAVIDRAKEGGEPVMWLIYIMGLSGAFLTAFYMFRLISYTFLGGYKKYGFRGATAPHHPHEGEADTDAYAPYPVPDGPFAHESHLGKHHVPEPKEVPPSMWIPLSILAVFSLLYGLIGMPFLGEGNLVGKFLTHGHPHFPEVTMELIIPMVISLVVALLGVHFGLKVNNTEWGERFKAVVKEKYRGLYLTLFNKYYIDEFYEEYIIQPVLILAQVARTFDNYVVDGIVNAAGWLTWQLSMLQGWWDNTVVDGLVNFCAWIVGFISDTVKPIQSGYVQNYMMVIVLFVMFYLLTLFVK